MAKFTTWRTITRARIVAMWKFLSKLTDKSISLIFLISVGAIFIHGYSFSTGDQTFQVPQILKRVDPNLFQRDYLATTTEGELSLFFPAMAFLINSASINIEPLYFGLYLIFHFLIIAAIYSLSYSLTQSRVSSIIATLLLALPKFVGGTTINTLDTSWLPRLAALPLLLFAFQKLTKQKYAQTAFLSGVILLIHPFSAVTLGIFLLGFLIMDKNKPITFIKSAIAGFIPSSWFLFTKIPFLIKESSQLIMPDSWYQIVVSRAPYNFASLWQFSGWASLAIVVIIGSIFFFNYHRSRDQNKAKFANLLKKTFLIASAVTLGQIFLAEFIKLTLIIQLQLLRIWLIPVYLAFIAAGRLITDMWDTKKIMVRITALLLFLILATNFGKTKIQPVELPWGPKREWDYLQKWVRDNTSQDALFITPATRVGFRIHSHRAIVGEIKDGSAGLYSYHLATSWQERVNDLGLINLKTEAEIVKLKEKYRADYLVTFKPQSFQRFIPVYKTETFIVYKL